ncbi:GNAT family N-acetyltransferase [Gilliamella sp. wkB112]|uniref:GNAT family N-acetyltransferase n=1 Tax=Gilliamella sp. wkB112 TaxID=3120257 RepID=UPI00080E542B|nr:GNAT family N-acetyltransferase [Gilliamella apicola]OCG02223.1 GCN5 family acetyltransferase [Gilliamella apicola]
MQKIVYRSDHKPSLSQAISLYSNCSLGARRPITDSKRFQAMLDNANLMITAWDDQQLIGIARCLTDFVYITYLADLAVDERYQHQGIGKQLIREIQKHTASNCKITLLAAPQAVDYYPLLGFQAHPSAWTLNELLQ